MSAAAAIVPLLLLIGAPSHAQSARQWIQQAEELQSVGNHGGAVELLRLAVKEHPKSNRLYGALDAAELQWAAAIAREALALDPRQLDLRYEAYEKAAEVRRSAPGVAALRTEIEAEVERRVQLYRRAVLRAREGDVEGAMAAVQGLESRNFRLADENFSLDQEREWQELLAEARSAVATDPFGPTTAGLLDQIMEWRPEFEDAVELRTRVGDAHVDKARALLSEAAGNLAVLLQARELVSQAVARCAACAAQVEGELEAQFVGETRKLAESYLELDTPAGVWAAHRVWSHWMDTWKSLGGRPSPVPDWSAHDWSAALVAAGGCTENESALRSLANEVLAGLSHLPGVRLIYEGSELPTKPYDLVVRLRGLDCPTAEIEETDVRVVSSTYHGGTQQLVNPDYTKLQTELNAVLGIRAGNPRPENFIELIGSIANNSKVTRLRRALANTPPYIETPIAVPYTYEEYESLRVAEARAAVELIDPRTQAVGASRELEAAAEVNAWGARGVAQSDRSGARSRSPSFSVGLDALAVRAARDLGQQVSAVLPDLSSEWLIRRAASEHQAGNAPSASAHLVALADSDMLEEHREGLSAEVANLRWLPLSMAAAEVPELIALDTAPTATATGLPSPAPTSDRASMVEKALDAVVSLRTTKARGTGFFVAPGGLLVTNHHVIEGHERVEVRVHSGDSFLGQVIATDPKRDLALIRIPAKSPAVLELRRIDSVPLAADVYALGSPEGLDWTVSRGIVSARRVAGDVDYIQTDAPINPGSSGGPLLLEDGSAVGVNTWKFREGEGLGFAVAVDEIFRAFRGELQEGL